MSRRPRNIYEELVIEGIKKRKNELLASISPMERELEEAERNSPYMKMHREHAKKHGRHVRD